MTCPLQRPIPDLRPVKANRRTAQFAGPAFDSRQYKDARQWRVGRLNTVLGSALRLYQELPNWKVPCDLIVQPLRLGGKITPTAGVRASSIG